MATTFRINRANAYRVSHQAAKNLVQEVNMEVIEGAYIILSAGKYTKGNLRRGLKSRIIELPQSVRGRVGISSLLYSYAAAVEAGAQRHFITPRPPKTILKFFWRKVGRVVYFDYVDHPGQSGKGYLRIPLARAAARHNMVLVTYAS